MKVRFWGVRGSIPTPLTINQIQGKISSIAQRLSPADLVSEESIEKFLAMLPPYLMGAVGGNTTCVEVRLNDDTIIIFDCGSGITDLAHALKKEDRYIRTYHIFFSHFHWDHIQGLPFFVPIAYDPKCTIHFYSPIRNFEDLLKNQMKVPYFPVTMDVMGADISYHVLTEPIIRIGSSEVMWKRVKHPGGCFNYKVRENGNTLIFATDTELTEQDFKKTKENVDFYEDVDAIILDSQYTLGEAIEKYDWGHSSYSMAVDFVNEWAIKNLYLFHHEPQYDDKKIYSILQSAKWYMNHLDPDHDKNIYLARENLEFDV
ncbi:MAG: MBL fold metallo-hydrolase [Spirochaetales bacterium]|nr:MAG: MBL fold metallo-hydrolase [Spirochaetales bacterium]